MIGMDAKGKFPVVTMTTKRVTAANKPSKLQTQVPLKRSYRPTSNTIVKTVADCHYRVDLKSAALKRFAALHRFNKVLAGTKLKSKSNLGRGTKQMTN
jgi:hypothetical protein